MFHICILQSAKPVLCKHHTVLGDSVFRTVRTSIIMRLMFCKFLWIHIKLYKFHNN